MLQIDAPATPRPFPDAQDPTGPAVLVPKPRRRLSPAMAAGVAGGFFALGLLGTAVVRSVLRTGPTPTPTIVGARTITPGKTQPGSTPTILAVGTQLATPLPTPRAAAQRGKLTVYAAPWCRVLVDGKEVADETPLENHSLTAGRHTLRFENAVEKFRQEKTVDIKPGEKLEIFVDVSKKTVKVSQR